MSSLRLDDYKIAWICALALEAAAARAMLDKIHTPPESIVDPITDWGSYHFGEINGHNIVIACLPVGEYGSRSVATASSRLRLTFPGLRFGLMVGIGGGAPSESNDIRLGDVVVSKPGGNYSGVIQYSYGKANQGGRFEATGSLNQPPQALLTHIHRLETNLITSEDAISEIVEAVLVRNPRMEIAFSPPDHDEDFLFNSSYHHVDISSNCEKCDKEQLVKRPPRDVKTPVIHYGLIASGERVMKDPKTRDRLAQEFGILCLRWKPQDL